MKQLNKTFLALLALCTILISAAPAQAQTTNDGPHVSYKLIPERTQVSPGEELLIGIQNDIVPHWHIYWRNPGDSGLPVENVWTLPEGFEISDISWPVPQKIYEGPLANYGYFDKATFLQTLKIPENLPEGPIDLNVEVKLLVCNEICVPEKGTLTLHLNDPASQNVDNTEALATAKQFLPAKAIPAKTTFHRTSNGNGTATFNLHFEPEDLGTLNKITPESAEFFPQEWGIVNYPAHPDVKIEDGVLILHHETSEDRDFSEITTLKGLLTYTGADGKYQAIQIEATPSGISSPSSAQVAKQEAQTKDISPATNMTLIAAITAALIGGLILNLMPCVFPVLSIKALSLVKMADKHPKTAKRSGLAYTAGVILSFLLIGATPLILKQAGSAIGWGFQLQNPVIVGLLAYLLFAIGLNLMSFFEITSSFGNIGGKLAPKESPVGAFFTGILATIVAAPCTAPFMGAALGFAIVQPAPAAMSIFAALGAGLALPYLLLSYVPALRHILPKPGPWMLRFKQFLAFPMFASAIWLVWVISQQAGAEGILVVLLGMLSFALAVWLSHLKPKKTLFKIITRALMILCIIIPFTTLVYLKTKADDVACSIKTYDFGEDFSQSRLETELKTNKPVFTEMTAAWCITCKVNHAIAIDTKATRDLFHKNNITYLVGDWTNQNKDITEYLEKHDRSGVPLYIYYAPPDLSTGARPPPKILPQVLTPSIVKDVIEGKT